MCLRCSKGGFTLLEVLVTVAIVAVLLGLTGATLVGTINNAPRARLRAEEETEILRVSSILRRQLLTMATSSVTRDPLVGASGKDPHTDSFSVITASLLHTAATGLAEWRIVQEPGQASYLSYRETPYLGGDVVGKDPREVFSRMIRGLDIRYWSAPDWVEGWKREALPERIRVTGYYVGPGGDGSFTVEAAPGIAMVGPPLPGMSPLPANASPAPSSSQAPSSSPPPATQATPPPSSPTPQKGAPP